MTNEFLRCLQLFLNDFRYAIVPGCAGMINMTLNILAIMSQALLSVKVDIILARNAVLGHLVSTLVCVIASICCSLNSQGLVEY